MKAIVETVDKEIYVELVLTDYNMDLLDDGRLLTKALKIGHQAVNFAIRKETKEEKDEI